jgi:serine/threonine protein kinase
MCQQAACPSALRLLCCVQILMGLNHMHSKKILHRDIKTLNVFLDENLNVKLGDMGVAKVCASRVVPETSTSCWVKCSTEV